jgi:hypothetical protein
MSHISSHPDPGSRLEVIASDIYFTKVLATLFTCF